MMKTIRVLHVLHGMNRGGAENAIMNYYRHIDRKVVQFDFLVTAYGKCDFDDEIVSLGGNIYHIPPLTIKSFFSYMRSVQSFFKVHNYKIVHSHTSSKSVLPLFLAKWANVPVRISHSHATDYGKGIRGIEQRLLKPFLGCVATDKFACGEKAAIWLYGKKSFDRGEIKIFYNVIEAEKHDFNCKVRDEIRNKYNIRKNVMVIGHTARFNWIKNHMFDIDLLQSLKRRGCEAMLLWVGDGELRSELSVEIKRRGLEHDVIMTGVVDNVSDYEQAMDIFILPSFNEGLPVSVIEAQASGLTCFVTDTIDKTCNITGNVHFLSLSKGVEEWTNSILSCSLEQRCSQLLKVSQAGYEAKTSANKLQNFYVKKILLTNNDSI